MRQGGSLSSPRDERGGRALPRGRSSLPASDVAADQRKRLLGAAVATVAEKGVHGVTVADIVRRARVSRATFYAHFSDKDACVLAAGAHGWAQLSDAVTAGSRAVPEDADPELHWRAACRAFLRFLADEPAFARLFYVDLPAVGGEGVARHDAATHQFARFNQAWHERARRRHPDWPRVPFDAYVALVGATTELVSTRVHHDRIGELPDLEDTLTALHLAVLAGRPWPAG
ncbi:TetR/AcrR family transcriptional regulator [Pseudonocardia humida]|uniref:TetR/AcrR family transcriptional regulator n=1 Tax=Pseudonocardia humida TaxID=2800819 RepID=A0ABT1A057_9PSEU|nr:TetR/AcrR family transcriptional regulator [Pseudonocardia humida]MCO1656194.1 TetR/AcrR family transcriptional regulator [Pseudonocardia humida]